MLNNLSSVCPLIDDKQKSACEESLSKTVIKKTFLPAGKNVPIINIRTRNINEKKRRKERRRKGKRRILPQKVNKMSHFCSIR